MTTTLPARWVVLYVTPVFYVAICIYLLFLMFGFIVSWTITEVAFAMLRKDVAPALRFLERCAGHLDYALENWDHNTRFMHYASGGVVLPFPDRCGFPYQGESVLPIDKKYG